MKRDNRFWTGLLLTVLAAAGAACSPEDEPLPADPEGAVTLNMMDEDNGRNTLGNSGIYIDRGQNFVAGDDCVLFAAGPAGSLGGVAVPALVTAASSVAVQPGCGYIAARPRALTVFPSGRMALPIDGVVDYIKFWVASALLRDGNPAGAVVRYAILQPESYGLPEFGSTVLAFRSDLMNLREDLALTLPTEEFECDFEDSYGQFEWEKQGNRLVLRLSAAEITSGTFALRLRVRESYTRVFVEVYTY